MIHRSLLVLLIIAKFQTSIWSHYISCLFVEIMFWLLFSRACTWHPDPRVVSRGCVVEPRCEWRTRSLLAELVSAGLESVRWIGSSYVDTLRLTQNGCRFALNISKFIFFMNLYFKQISLKFVPIRPFNNKRALVQIMSWRRQVIIWTNGGFVY